MTPDLPDLTERLLAAATAAGADAADALATEGTSISIQVLDGKLEQAERTEGVEMGLRVLVGRRQACVSASDIRPEIIEEMGRRAVAMAREAPEDPHIGLAAPDQLSDVRDAAALDLVDPGGEPAAADLQDAALAAEAAAANVAGVSKVQAAASGHSRSSIWLAATNGFSGGYARTSTAVQCVAITGEGTKMERDYFGDSRSHRDALFSPEEIGRTAGERAVERSCARKPPTGAYPVLYDERISSGLIGHLLQAASGSGVARGSSWLMDKLGDEVLPSHVTLFSDPHRPRVSGSRPFDAEGLRTRRRAIVDAGRLTGWTLDLGTARKLGMVSTANAGRGVSGPPSPTLGNVTLTGDAVPRQQLLSDMGTGLLVTSLIGASINPTTGDYSRGASGFWVENGEIAYPVNECTIAGNLRDMLRTIRPADDARPWLSRVVPSLLVEGLTLAGD